MLLASLGLNLVVVFALELPDVLLELVQNVHSSQSLELVAVELVVLFQFLLSCLPARKRLQIQALQQTHDLVESGSPALCLFLLMRLLQRDDVFLKQSPALGIVFGRAEDGFLFDDGQSSLPARVVLDLRVRAQHGGKVGP